MIIASELDWTTQRPGLDGAPAHLVCFQPQRWPCWRPAVSVDLSERSLLLSWMTPDGGREAALAQVSIAEPVGTESCISAAFRAAASEQAAVVILCDTRGQALRAARIAARYLPNGYWRLPLERLEIDPDTRLN